uniref:Glycosyltransferase family 92 protein n=1 Tax=Caenorhabditis japonica TaxID=281687 RepID=A0A8R1DJ73_CAEJA
MNWKLLAFLFITVSPATGNENAWLAEKSNKVVGNFSVPYDVQWEMKEPIGSLQGTYHLEEVDFMDFPPVLATVWSPEENFGLVAWPPKYCHAVEACFIDTSQISKNVLHITPSYCSDLAVRFYPHIGKLVVKNGGSEVEMFNQASTVSFRASGKDLIVQGSESYQTKSADWQKLKPKTVTLTGAKGRSILLLTNSRFCFAHVSQPMRNAKFRALLHPRRHKDYKKLPFALTSYLYPEGERTIFNPPISEGGKKKYDVMSVLKGSKFLVNSVIQQSATCSSFQSKSLNPLKHSIGVISVDSWEMMQDMSTFTNRMESFQIRIGKQCSWIRLWFGGANEDMSKYDKAMKLENTIDLFLDQQFVLGPDSDEARPLSGDSSLIGTISVRRFRVASDPKKNIVELSYGKDRGPVFPFKEYFHMPAMYAKAVTLNIIKAPECSAVLVPGSLAYRFGSGYRPPWNVLTFQNCKRFSIEPEPRLKKDHEDRMDKIPTNFKIPG